MSFVQSTYFKHSCAAAPEAGRGENRISDLMILLNIVNQLCWALLSLSQCDAVSTMSYCGASGAAYCRAEGALPAVVVHATYIYTSGLNVLLGYRPHCHRMKSSKRPLDAV